MVATQVDSSHSSSSSYDNSYTDGANDNLMSSSTDDEAVSVSISVPAAVTIMTTAIIMMMTVFHESPSAIHNWIFPAVADAVTRTTTAYVLLSYNIDSSSPAIYDEDSSVVTTSPSVSIADEATSSVTLSTRDFDIA